MAPSNLSPFLIFFILSSHSLIAAGQSVNSSSTANSTVAPPPTAAAAFKPGIAAIVGILTTIFSITFLILLYVKHCKRSAYANASRSYYYPPARRDSGINRKVISSLPMFRFSSLRGQKEGLECAVCLNRFEAEELLRLLPKCKHAFHVECVDTWLEAHSTCPLCRYRVDPEDVLLLVDGLATPRTSGAAATRISGRHSSAGERGGSALEIIAEKGRVSLDSWNSSRRKPGRKDGQLLVQGDKRRVEHRIIISGGGEGEEEEAARRWSDVQAAELLYLGSEMLLGEGSGRGVINGRSVSEITGVSRYGGNNGGGGKEEREREEERVVKRWLAWISQSQHQHQNPAVQTAAASSPSPTIVL